jgi:small-conductance mechanosensitive channel
MILRFRRLTNDLRTGWAKVRQGTTKAADRSLEEMELLRLKFTLYKVEDQIKEHLRAAGERAFQLIERKGSGVLEDKEIKDLFAKVDQLKQEETRIRFEMDQIKERG